jgi:hypothetical protein
VSGYRYPPETVSDLCELVERIEAARAAGASSQELREVLAPARLESTMPLEWMVVEPDDFNDEHLQPLMELREIEGRLAQLEEVPRA